MGKIGTKLQEIREKYGLNQTELAEKLGFSRSYIAMVEAEKTQVGGFIPSLDFIRTLASSFSLNRGELEKLRDSEKNDKAKTDISRDNLVDLRKYLSIILLSAELLTKQEKWLSDKGKERVQIIKKQVWKINKLFPKI